MDVGFYFSTTLVGGELRGQGWAGRCGGERTVTRTKVAAPRESGGEMRGAESAASARLRAAWAFGGGVPWGRPGVCESPGSPPPCLSRSGIFRLPVKSSRGEPGS